MQLAYKLLPVRAGQDKKQAIANLCSRYLRRLPSSVKPKEHQAADIRATHSLQRRAVRDQKNNGCRTRMSAPHGAGQKR